MTPDMLIDLLQSLRGRLRQLSAAYGVGVVLALVGVTFVLLSLLDYTLHLSQVWRALLLCAGIGFIGAAVFRSLWLPLQSKLPVTDIAGRIEERFPQFQDRLRSAVGFIQSPTSDSPTMQKATIEQAVNLSSALPLQDVLDVRPALRSIGLGLLVIVVIALGLVAMDGSTRSILFSRVFNPFSNVQWPKRVQIAMIEPIPTRVPANGRVNIAVRLERGDSSKMRPIVFYQNENGGLRQEFLSRGDDGRYTASLDARTESPTKGGSMKVWIVAGDDRTQDATVQIVPRLGVETFLATITPPAYINKPAAQPVNLLGQQAIGFIGSTIDFTVGFSKPISDLASVKLIPMNESTAPAITWQAIDEKTIRGQMKLESSMQFRVDASDADGFDVASQSDFEVIAKPDQLPAVFIENPRKSEERTPEATIPLVGVAEDDAGVRDVSLVVTRLGQTSKSWTIPLITEGSVAANATAIAWNKLTDASDRERFRAEYAWVLAALPDAKLKGGDVLEYGLVVTDNYELDGQRHPPVESPKLRITIISQEELSNRITDELRQVKTQLGQVKQQHDRTSAETDSFKNDVASKPQLDEADASVATRLQQQQSTVASATKSLSDRLGDLRKTMEENKSTSTDLAQLSKDVGDRLNQTAEGSMKTALRNMSQAGQKSAEAAAREKAIEQTQDAQKQASDELAETLKRLEDIGSLNAMIDSIQKMLDAQRGLAEQTREIMSKNVGKKPEQMSPADRKKLDDLAAEQAKLADASQKAMDRLGKTAEQLAKSDPASSEAMKQAQKQGQRQNVSQNQKQASQQMKQNKQSDAKQSQQQAELGLETMLNELRDAQKRKLAELQKKLAELQQQIEILIRRQSGHNVDNLTLQGGETLEKQKDVVVMLLETSGKKPGEKTELPRLLNGQGQTERNTRDIGKKAADLPDGAEPASRLTRAATQMERAAVYLRDKKLTDAYEPPQREALTTLEDAKRLIEEQKNKVDDEMAQQEKEAIRQAYVRIKAEQQKLADETTRLETSRNPQGVLNRADLIRLGQLPSEQQKLADQIRKVGEDLSSLKSTVYTWANKQIETQMGEIKSDLGGQKTAAPTQRKHKQVLDDLQAMIDNLKVTPREQKFEKGSGGGGEGQAGAKPMPPEAELRLMKSLQQVLNGQTVEADASIVANKGEKTDEMNEGLVQLGRRQSQFRKLLDDMLSAASKGAVTLGPEPKDGEPLAEEATIQQIDEKELEQELLAGDPGAKDKEIDVRRIGDRMARVRQRLELDRNAGRVTQVIQKRILTDFDLLIEAARQQQCKGGGQSKPKDGEQAPQPDPGQEQAQNKGQNKANPGAQAANNSKSTGPSGTHAGAGRDIREMSEEWGKISPRLRGPILESRDETIIERYRRLIEDYTQAVSIEASGGSSGTSPPPPTEGDQ
jgi:hypothetical protein